MKRSALLPIAAAFLATSWGACGGSTEAPGAPGAPDVADALAALDRIDQPYVEQDRLEFAAAIELRLDRLDELRSLVESEADAAREDALDELRASVAEDVLALRQEVADWETVRNRVIRDARALELELRDLAKEVKS